MVKKRKEVNLKKISIKNAFHAFQYLGHVDAQNYTHLYYDPDPDIANHFRQLALVHLKRLESVYSNQLENLNIYILYKSFIDALDRNNIGKLKIQ